MSGWIKCSDRLPEPETDVLVHIEGGNGVYPRLLHIDDVSGQWMDEWGHVFDGSDDQSTVECWHQTVAYP